MKTMTPMIAAKNMAGKETVDSSMLSACSLPAPLHNAIVCANRWFCWQRLDDHKAAEKGMRGRRPPHAISPRIAFTAGKYSFDGGKTAPTF